MAQGLRRHTPNAGGVGSIPARGTQISQASSCTQGKKKTVLRVTCNLPGNGGNLLTLLTDKAGVGLLLHTVIFADGGGVLEGKTTSGFTGQTYTI